MWSNIVIRYRSCTTARQARQFHSLHQQKLARTCSHAVPGTCSRPAVSAQLVRGGLGPVQSPHLNCSGAAPECAILRHETRDRARVTDVPQTWSCEAIQASSLRDTQGCAGIGGCCRYHQCPGALLAPPPEAGGWEQVAAVPAGSWLRNRAALVGRMHRPTADRCRA